MMRLAHGQENSQKGKKRGGRSASNPVRLGEKGESLPLSRIAGGTESRRKKKGKKRARHILL